MILPFFDYISAERKGKFNELKISAAPLFQQEQDVVRARMDNVAYCLVAIPQLEQFLIKKISTKNTFNGNFSNLKKLFSMVENAFILLSRFNKITSQIETKNDINLDSAPNDTSSSDILHRDVAFH